MIKVNNIITKQIIRLKAADDVISLEEVLSNINQETNYGNLHSTNFVLFVAFLSIVSVIFVYIILAYRGKLINLKSKNKNSENLLFLNDAHL